MLNVIYAECHIQALYSECRYAECRSTLHGLAEYWWASSSQPTKEEHYITPVPMRGSKSPSHKTFSKLDLFIAIQQKLLIFKMAQLTKKCE